MYSVCLFFFFNDTATTEIYTLSLHDALPIYVDDRLAGRVRPLQAVLRRGRVVAQQPLGEDLAPLDREGQADGDPLRSEEHTSELQSRQYLVCRLLLEKKKQSNH